MQAIKIPAPVQIFNKICCSVEQRKYEVLLLSFMLLIFGNTFSQGRPMAWRLDIYQNFIIGFLVFYSQKRLRWLILSVIVITLIMDVFENSVLLANVKILHGYLFVLFFSLVSIEVYREVLYVKTVSRELLAAALCGFVLLCMVATFLFVQIDVHVPHSFSNTGTDKETTFNLNYFSFTTLLTVGYGDITPVTLVAKRAVMLMGLMGHFYTVFITSIIIGKYLSARKS